MFASKNSDYEVFFSFWTRIPSVTSVTQGHDGTRAWERMGVRNNRVRNSEFQWLYYNKVENSENTKNIPRNMPCVTVMLHIVYVYFPRDQSNDLNFRSCARTIYGKEAWQRSEGLKNSADIPRVVYDISRITEKPCCSPLMELYCGFVVLIPVVYVLNLSYNRWLAIQEIDENTRKRAKTHVSSAVTSRK